MKIIESELLGIFGLSWQEKVANLTYQKTAKTDKELSRKLKDFWQSGGLNVTLINNLYMQYAALMASGYMPSSFKNGEPDKNTKVLIDKINAKLNIDKLIIKNFLDSIFQLSSEGKIPLQKWNPKGYKETQDLVKTFPSETSIFDKVKKSTNTVSSILIVAGIATTLYYLNSIGKARYGTKN